MSNSIINAISFILVGIVITFIFSYIRKKILTKATNQVLNSSIGRKLKNGEEVFEAKKFFKGLNPFDMKLWAKSITFLFRYFLIFSIVFGVIYGYGWWKGRGDTPIQITLAETQKEWELKIPKHAKRLYHPENSRQLYWIDRTGKKVPIKVEDIPQLNELLKPYGLEFTPIGVIGGGVGEEGSGVEGGAGIRFLRYYRWRLDAFLTNRGIYAGVAYKLEGLKLSNSALGLAVGKGYSGDNRLLFYFSMEF